MRDQKIGHWWGISVQLPDANALKTGGLKETVSVFAKNARQALALSKFPQEMCLLGQRIKMSEIAACQQLGHHDIALGVCPSEKVPEVLQRSRDILSGKVPANASTFSHMLHPSDFVNHVDEHTRDIYDTLMNAQLVLSWTAFETLAGDLWETAINTHLEALVSRSWQGKQVPFELIRDSDYCLKNKMGTILRKHLNRKNDLSYSQIVDQYLQTFNEGNAGSKAFWNDARIGLPYSLRNLIVHRAGVVDDKFRKEWETGGRVVCCDTSGRFLLDGEVLSTITDGLFGAANDLINSVDGFIDRHSKPPASGGS